MSLIFLASYLLIIATGLRALAPYVWPGELFSPFVWHYVVIGALLAVTLLLQKQWSLGLLMMAVAFWHFSATLPMWFKEVPPLRTAEEQQAQIRVLQFNLYRNNKQPEKAIEWLTKQAPNIDVMMLCEFTDAWKKLLPPLAQLFPHHFVHEVREGRQIVVLTKLPFQGIDAVPLKEDMFAIRIKTATPQLHHPLTFYAIHVPTPLLPKQEALRNTLLVQAATELLKEPASYKILIGDFNTTRFSPWFKKLEAMGLRDSFEGRYVLGTWPSFLPSFAGLMIDHLLVSEGLLVENKTLGPALGSDHRPVFTVLSVDGKTE